MAINYTCKGKALLIFVPFELKDFFRSRHPSASWNPQLRKWELKDSAGTRAKLDAMIKELATDPSCYQAALAMNPLIGNQSNVWDELDYLEDTNPAAAQRLRNRMEYRTNH